MHTLAQVQEKELREYPTISLRRTYLADIGGI